MEQIFRKHNIIRIQNIVLVCLDYILNPLLDELHYLKKKEKERITAFKAIRF